MASDLEPTKQRDKVIQECKEEPKELAISSAIPQATRSFGENSMSYQVVSRAKENVLKQHGAQVEAFADVSQGESEKSRNSGQKNDQDFPVLSSSLWTMEQGGSKLVHTYENETTQVNGCAEHNVGVTSPPRNETSLFGAKIRSSQVRGERQPDSSSQPPVKENGIAKQNIGARSPSRIGSSGVIARQADQPPQQSMSQVDEVNKESVASGELDEATGSRKQAKVRTLDTEYGISREVLEHYSAMKLEDVAVDLGVSRSTLKRICRKCGIYRWPPSKAKKHNHQEFIQDTRRSIEESSQRIQPVFDIVPFVPLENISASQMQTTPEAKLKQDDSSIMVKVTCKDDIIKFRLSLASSKLDLEKEVTKRLNLSVGSFKIKYLDEDGDWVLIACDADLETCISTLGKTTIRMLID